MKRNWKEAIFEEEYMREKSRAFFKKNAEREALQKKKGGLLGKSLTYITPLAIILMGGYLIYIFGDTFAISLRGTFDSGFFLSIGVLVALFLVALKS